MKKHIITCSEFYQNSIGRGSALREIGPRLFSHDLIFESVESNLESAHDLIFIEVAKCLLKDPSSMLKIQSIDFSGDLALFNDPNSSKEGLVEWEAEWKAHMSFSLSDAATSQFISKLQDHGIITGIIDDVLSDFLDVDDSIKVDIYFNSEIEWYQRYYDSDDDWDLSSVDFTLEDVSTYIDSIMINGSEYIIDGDISNLKPHLRDLYEKLSSSMQKLEPDDLYRIYKH